MERHLVYEVDRIEMEEVIIADVHSLPVTLDSEPFVYPNLTISLNHSGTAHTLYDMHPVATGKSAAKWIDEILILHAKRLLQTRHDMTVQQVAYQLGFKENATFCRFFKDQTGYRPSEYRKGI